MYDFGASGTLSLKVSISYDPKPSSLLHLPCHPKKNRKERGRKKKLHSDKLIVFNLYMAGG